MAPEDSTEPTGSDAAPAGSPGTCTSCGDEADDILAVRRLYLMPDAESSAAGDEGRFSRSDEVEHWCYVCRTHYPHELVS